MMTPARRLSLRSKVGAPYWPTSQPRRLCWARPSLTPPDCSSRSRFSCVLSVNSVPPRASPCTSTAGATRSGALFDAGPEWGDRDGIDRDVPHHRDDRDQQAAFVALGAIVLAV